MRRLMIFLGVLLLILFAGSLLSRGQVRAPFSRIDLDAADSDYRNLQFAEDVTVDLFKCCLSGEVLVIVSQGTTPGSVQLMITTASPGPTLRRFSLVRLEVDDSYTQTGPFSQELVAAILECCFSGHSSVSVSRDPTTARLLVRLEQR